MVRGGVVRVYNGCVVGAWDKVVALGEGSRHHDPPGDGDYLGGDFSR